MSSSMISRFLSPYYIVNTLCLLSYVPIRSHLPHGGVSVVDPYFGIPKETEIIMMAVFFLISKYNKCPTMEAFANTFFLFGHLAVLTCYYFIGWSCAICYAMVYLVLLLTFRQPKYKGPDEMIQLNPDAFERRIKHGGGSTAWVVYFYADWCDSCLQHDPMIAALSLEYACPTLKFAKIDVARYPEMAEEYGISTSPMARQMPTLILFQKGKEKTRLPPFNKEGKVVRTIMEKKGVAAVFQLQKHGQKDAAASS